MSTAVAEVVNAMHGDEERWWQADNIPFTSSSAQKLFDRGQLFVGHLLPLQALQRMVSRLLTITFGIVERDGLCHGPWRMIVPVISP